MQNALGIHIKIKIFRKCVLVTHQKKKKWFQKGILGVKAATNTWRESGDWVALHNIISRGSTHISDGKWITRDII